MSAIISFSGPFRFLSNFYLSRIVVDYISYPSVENYFQAQKAEDPAMRHHISIASPSQAKALGRKAMLVADWEKKKRTVMRDGVYHKFLQNEDLLSLLRGTGRAYLIEGNNWHDNYWGACWCAQCKTLEHKNMLGTLLMEVRREL